MWQFTPYEFYSLCVTWHSGQRICAFLCSIWRSAPQDMCVTMCTINMRRKDEWPDYVNACASAGGLRIFLKGQCCPCLVEATGLCQVGLPVEQTIGGRFGSSQANRLTSQPLNQSTVCPAVWSTNNPPTSWTANRWFLLLRGGLPEFQVNLCGYHTFVEGCSLQQLLGHSKLKPRWTNSPAPSSQPFGIIPPRAGSLILCLGGVVCRHSSPSRTKCSAAASCAVLWRAGTQVFQSWLRSQKLKEMAFCAGQCKGNKALLQHWVESRFMWTRL